MVVIPAGQFMMGSPATEEGHDAKESPQHLVTIGKPFAVSKFAVTFADWDACVSVGGCPHVSDSGFEGGTRPVINLRWEEAQQYAAWFSKMTGRPYRLLTETEWEYAARAGSSTAYFWGDQIGQGNANCRHCGSQWDDWKTSPVGSFKPNAFGLYDMAGNVWQWVQDCYHDDYNEAPTDGSVWVTPDCPRRGVRGGSWGNEPPLLRSANRGWWSADDQDFHIGFRLARALAP
jgi:formylglycine-generating enzyme required for sulfatase activity